MTKSPSFVTRKVNRQPVGASPSAPVSEVPTSVSPALQESSVTTIPNPDFTAEQTANLIGIAGRWQGVAVIGSGLSYLESTLQVDFYGPDSSLSGHIWATQSGAQAGTTIDPFQSGGNEQANTLDEPLADVSITENTVSFSAPYIGEIVGVLSDDRTTITSEREDFTAPLTLRKIASGSQFLARPNDNISDSTYTIAGEWRSTQVFGGSPLPNNSVLALHFEGPDALLTGKLVTVHAPSLQGAHVTEETLTRIIKDGRNLRISSPSLGNVTGLLSSDNTALVFSVDSIADGGLVVFEKQ